MCLGRGRRNNSGQGLAVGAETESGAEVASEIDKRKLKTKI